MTALEAAQSYVARGLCPIPIPTREKAPKITGWPSLRLGAAELSKYFNGVPSNIGVLLGDEYGTSDVDLDSTEALAVAAALLPETGMVFGRKSKPASHYFFRSDPPCRSRRYLDPVSKACLVELRCRKGDGTVGLQTVVPPSVHPQGEEIRFDPDATDTRRTSTPPPSRRRSRRLQQRRCSHGTGQPRRAAETRPSSRWPAPSRAVAGRSIRQ